MANTNASPPAMTATKALGGGAAGALLVIVQAIAHNIWPGAIPGPDVATIGDAVAVFLNSLVGFAVGYIVTWLSPRNVVKTAFAIGALVLAGLLLWPADALAASLTIAPPPDWLVLAFSLAIVVGYALAIASAAGLLIYVRLRFGPGARTTGATGCR